MLRAKASLCNALPTGRPRDCATQPLCYNDDDARPNLLNHITFTRKVTAFERYRRLEIVFGLHIVFRHLIE